MLITFHAFSNFQALNIVPCDKDKLDDFLMSSFQRNVPPNFNLLQTSGLGQLHRGVISKFPIICVSKFRFCSVVLLSSCDIGIEYLKVTKLMETHFFGRNLISL